MASNTVIFAQMCELATELEDVTPIHPRVQQRLCNAFDRAISKALSINFAYAVPDPDYVQHTLARHAERGIRDFVP